MYVFLHEPFLYTDSICEWYNDGDGYEPTEEWLNGIKLGLKRNFHVYKKNGRYITKAFMDKYRR